MRDDGTWSRANNISSWADSQGGTSTILAEGSKGNNTTYNVLSIAARKNSENYELAKYYFAESKLKTGEDRIALWEKTLDLTPEYAPVYREMMNDMKNRGAAPEEWYQLSLRVLKNFRNYPKPMIDLLNISTPYFSNESSDNWPLLADFAVRYVDTVDGVTEGKARDVYDNTQIENGRPFSPDYKNYYNKYSYLLGSFSFDGPFANRLKGAKVGSEYSLDGGVSFKPVLEDSPLIPLRETASISEENGIIIRLKGMEKGQKIKFKSSQQPTNLVANDEEDFIVGLNDKYEYSIDNGKSWISGDITPNLSGDKEVLVRVKRMGTNLGSEPIRLNFTSSSTIPNRILHSNMRLIGFSTQQNDTDQAARNAINGDNRDFWHTVWRGGDVRPYLTIEFDREYTLKSFHYSPRQDGASNGNILEYTISVSDNGRDWREVCHGNFNYNNGNNREAKTQLLPDGTRARFAKVTVLNGVSKFASASDISFGIDQEEASNAKISYEQRLDENLKPQYIEKLKKMSSDANDLKLLLYSRQVMDSTLIEKLSDFINRVDSAKSIESDTQMAKELSNLSEEYKKLNDEIIWSYNKVLLAFEPTDVSERYAQIKRNDEEKANEFKENYKTLLDLTVDNVSIEHYNDLMKAKYLILNKAPYTQKILEKESEHIQELLDAIAKKRDFIMNEEEGYRQVFKELMATDVSSVNQENYEKIENEVKQAEIVLQTLSPSARMGLGNVNDKILQMEEKLQELKAEKVKNRVVDYIKKHRNDFIEKSRVAEVWKNSIDNAEILANNPTESLNIEKMETLIFNLETKHAQLLYAEWQTSDDNDRVNKFKSDFSELLNKDLESVGAGDKETLLRALDSFRRLNDYQQSQLFEEREKLLRINQKIFENQDKSNYVQDLIKKLEVNLNTSASSARGDDRRELEALLARVRSIKNDSTNNTDEKLELYNEIERARMTVVKNYAPAKEKARYLGLGLDNLMSIQLATLSSENKSVLETEKSKVESIPNKEKEYLSEEVNHLNTLEKQMERLENPDEREALEREAESRKNAIEEIKNLTALNPYEKSLQKALINSARTAEEIKNRLLAAKKANDSKIVQNNKKEDKINKVLNYIDSLVNPENPNYQSWADEIIPKVKLVYSDYSREYLEQFNDRDNEWIYNQIVKRVAVLRNQSDEIMARKENEKEYDGTVNQFKKLITDAEALFVEDTSPTHLENAEIIEHTNAENAEHTDVENTEQPKVYIKSDEGKEKLNKLLEDARFAQKAGLGVQEIRNYMKNFESKLDKICKEEIALNNKKNEMADDKKPESEGDANSQGENAAATTEVGATSSDSNKEQSDTDTYENKEDGAEDKTGTSSNTEKTPEHTDKTSSNTEKNPEHTDETSSNTEKMPEHTEGTSENDEGSGKIESGKNDEEDDGVCLIPEESAHKQAVEKAVERISKLENLENEELETFVDELRNSHAGCDLNEIIIRAERKDKENLNKKIEEEALHSVLVENATEKINELENLKPEEKAKFIKSLESASNKDAIDKILKEVQEASKNNAVENTEGKEEKSSNSATSGNKEDEKREIVKENKSNLATESVVLNPVSRTGYRSVGSSTTDLSKINIDNKRYKVERIAGKDRIETSIKLAKTLYPNGAKTILIVNKDKIVDALASSALAKEMKAPILYTDKDSTPEKLLAAMKDLGAENLVLVGGQGAISDSQLKELETKGFCVDRIGGLDRYETSAMLAKELLKLKGKKPEEIILVSSENYADALSISAYATKKGVPVLLVGKDIISKDSENILKMIGDAKIHIIGGEKSISKSLENYLVKYTKYEINRVAGKDRYDTSKVISEKFAPNAKTAILVSGERFEDALISGTVAVSYDATILLCKKEGVSDIVDKYVSNSRIENMKIIGGYDVLSERYEEKYLKKEKL